MSEKLAKIAYLSIGSNLGNKKINIELSKYKLNNKDTEIIEVSNSFESLSWPNKNNPKFINVIIKIKTFLSPQSLMIKCLDIEKSLGRNRRKKNDPRTCDIDIIDYDNKIIHKQNLTFPHPEMHKRNFVLLSLFEINTSWNHPIIKINIKKLIKSTKTQDLISIKYI